MQRSLSVGHARPVGRALIGNILALSQTGAGGVKREPRGWRPALGPQREVVLFSGYLTNGDTLRLPARKRARAAAEQRDDPVEPQREERAQRPARTGDLEDGEAAAGPHDAAYLFDRFADLMGGRL